MAAPDTDRRLFSISRTHGPSAVDAAGASLLIGATVWLTVATAVRWRRLLRVGVKRLGIAALIYAAGAATLAPAVLMDLGLWWVPGAVAMASVQVAAAVAASGSGSRSHAQDE